MKLFNTLTKKVEEFKPIEEGKVRMYTCGPTVYDVPHIGNLRSFIFSNLLGRALNFDGFKVKKVMNITDVDDKTIKKGEGEWEKFKEITKKYEDLLWENYDELKLENPDVITHATAYIDQIIKFVQELEEKGFAYKAEDGSVYFSINKFKEYGRLSGVEDRELLAGARVSQDEYDKENPADFALWKAWNEADGEISWNSPWGKGRPGWHIECSVMATSELGEQIDIHTGGIDLVFPHHENEIAQTEAKTGKKFVNFWVHNEHLLVDGKKMSKSLNNFYTLKDIQSRGFSALDFKYLVLQSHYRSKMNFTWEAMESARNARKKLAKFVEGATFETQSDPGYLKKVRQILNNDLNTPEVLAIIFALIADERLPLVLRQGTLRYVDLNILGLDLTASEEIPEEILALAEDRKKAREEKDYKKSDELRDALSSKGWKIEDLENNKYNLNK